VSQLEKTKKISSDFFDLYHVIMKSGKQVFELLIEILTLIKLLNLNKQQLSCQ
jgi:hypothetical protein